MVATLAEARPAAPRAHGGFALVAALWLIVALGAVLGSIALDGRAERMATANAVAEFRAREAARSGIETAIAKLDALQARTVSVGGGEDAAHGARWLALQDELGDLDSLPIGRTSWVRTSARDAATRLNVNRATAVELRALATGGGVSPTAIDSVVDLILDWRDADGHPLPAGGEWANRYSRLEPPRFPRNGFLLSVWETADALDPDVPSLHRVLPYLTTVGDGEVNLNTAPPAVLMTLPGLGAEAAAAIVRSRSGRPLRSLDDVTAALRGLDRDRVVAAFPDLAGLARFTPRQIEVEATGHAVGSRISVRLRALVVRDGRRVQRVWMIES